MIFRLFNILWFLLFYSCFNNVYSQQINRDSNYIYTFQKQNILEANVGIYNTRFNFSDRGQRKNDYRLVANSNAYMGLFLNYKWLSLKYSIAMPGTQLDKNVKLEYQSIGFNISSGRLKFHPFYSSYNGLLVPQEHRGDYETFRDIQYSNTGIDFYYFTNTHKFSPGAASGYSKQQLKNAGTLFFMATPLWQKLNWKSPSRNAIEDSSTYNLLASDPQWVSLITRAGYNYNFTFKSGKWSIAPALIVGAGGLKELNTTKRGLQLVTDIQGWVSAGYNSRNYYIYFKAWWDNLQTNLLIKSMTRVNNDFSITAGFRFQNYKKKILFIL